MVLRNLLMSATDDVNDFCQRNSWLSDIWRYCSAWNQSQLAQLKGASVFVIEVCSILSYYAIMVCSGGYMGLH